MFGWGARARRVEAIESELTALSAKLAETAADAALETERAKAAAAMATLGDRLLELREVAVAQAERFAALEAGLAAFGQRVAAMEERLPVVDEDAQAAQAAAAGEAKKRQEKEFTFLRSSILALDREIKRHANEAEKADHALYERIDRVRQDLIERVNE